LERVGPALDLSVEEIPDCQGLEVSLGSEMFSQLARHPDIPPGFRLRALREDEAALVAEQWSSECIQEEALWRDRIRWMPSIAFEEEGSGRLVCFNSFSPVGFATHGWTLPDFRGRRLMLSLMQLNAASLEMDVYTLVLVKPSNQASIAAMRKSGLFLETEHRLDILRLSPAPNHKQYTVS
jgi:hypothetical protein